MTNNVVPLPNILLAARAQVIGIHEHKRTTSARKNPLDPQVVVTETVSLGYFMHLDFGPESGPISFGVGPEVPRGLKAGQTVIVAILAESKVD
jgi:hypothetical protein